MKSAILYKDFYKVSHVFQYPKGTTMVYSNFTARNSRIPGIDHVVVFGIQYFLKKYLRQEFDDTFFALDKDTVLQLYKHIMDNSLGPDTVSLDHIAALHDLRYLPLEIKALPEGTVCPLQVPILTIKNTKPEFFWLTNFIETLLSNVIWHPMTSATIAFQYRKILDGYAKDTSDIPEFVAWQGHDFSMRGQSSLESAMVSGGAHLLSFSGTDTIPAIPWLGEYYQAPYLSETIGGSVPATEHSVMCMGLECNEYDTFKRLITEVYPKGIISIVSDTWDFWKVMTQTLPFLKNDIMNRDGKVVIRPDSGDPYKIICGDPEAADGSPENFGAMRLLWMLFGGTVNSKGYMQLDPHIGLIYGDSITLDRCEAICANLKAQGFASTNMVFGIGSYTYQYVTRDTFGFAVKATYGEIDGVPRPIFKKPLTDHNFKASALGLLRVNEDLTLSQDVSKDEEREGLLQTVFLDGWIHGQTFTQIRERLLKQL